MADPNQNTSGRSWARRAGSELVDRLFLANRGHDYQSGYWNRDGSIQGGIQSGLGAINPGLGLLARFYFNRRNNGPMPLQNAQLDPVGNMQFQPGNYGGSSQFSPIEMGGQPQSPQFDPSNPFAMPQQPQGQPSSGTGTNWGRFTPNLQPATGGFQSLLSNQGGGARGMYSQGGYTGDAARSMFESMRRASAMAPIDTGPPRQA